ncbi:MAG: c-type cytochrome [Acidobacteriaceae bacterium]
MDLMRRILSILSTLAVVFFFTFPYVASAAETKKEPKPMANPAVQRGEAIFKTTCEVCHGEGATGGIGPNLMQSPIVRNPEKFENQVNMVIAQGRPDKGMPGFGSQLSASQISDVVAYLRSLLKANELHGGGNEAFLKQILVGDAAAGKQYFYGQGGCSRCHSPAGALAGIAKKYDAGSLEKEFLLPSQDNVTATITLPSGKQVQGKLLYRDPFYVAIRTEDFSYRSWPVDTVKVQVKDPLKAHRKLLSEYSDKDIYNVLAYLETLK